MARQYKRDARGRFASGGSTGRRAGGTLAARASLRRSRQKLASRDPADTSLRGTLSSRAQRAAVTRASKRLQQASRSSRVSIAGGRGGTLRRPKGYKPPGGRAAASAQLKNYLGRTSQSPDPVKVRQQASKPRAEPLTLGGGTLAARGSLKRSRAKLRENDTPSQRGAVTRANRYAGMAIKRERVTLGQSVKGRYVRGKRSQPAAPTPPARSKVPARGTLAARSRLGQARRDAAADFNPSTARALTKYNREAAVEARHSRRRIRQSPAGRYVRGKGRQAGPANSIRPTGGSIRPKGARNNVVPYKPTTMRGQSKQLQRRTKNLSEKIDRDVKRAKDVLRSLKSKTQKIKPKLDGYMSRIERENARSIANRRKKGVDGVIARADLDTMGSGPGRKAITRRMNRALDAASRGSKPAQRAVRVYLDQLAGTGPGKPSRGRNNLRPGPRNTKGTPKRRRKPKGKR